MKTVGIDIGLNGGIAILEKNKLTLHTMPVIEVMVGKKMRNQYDLQAIDTIFSTLGDCTATFERLKAIPGQSSQTAFSMGGGTMLFKTLCTVYGIPYKEIEPRMWQKEVFGEMGIQYDGKTTKQASILACKQLFPSASFVPAHCKKTHDGLTDATCIAYYSNKLMKSYQ